MHPPGGLAREAGPGPVPVPGPRRIDAGPARLEAGASVVVVLSAVVLQAANVRADRRSRLGEARSRGLAGRSAADLLRCEREHPSGSRVFNDYVLGGFLIYFTPDLKVFVNNHCEVYGDAWLNGSRTPCMTIPP